jgi:hypothetical protein
MPNSWTTVYRLATLKKPEFDRVAHHERFGPLMTAADVQSIISEQSGEDQEHVSRDVTIGLSGFDRQKKMAVFTKLSDLEREFGFQVVLSNDLRKEMTPQKKAKTTLAEIIRSAA